MRKKLLRKKLTVLKRELKVRKKESEEMESLRESMAEHKAELREFNLQPKEKIGETVGEQPQDLDSFAQDQLRIASLNSES